MRNGVISDEMWDVYCSRILVANDRRLIDPDSPFVRHNVQYIVHRHKIRVMRSLANAKTHSARLGVPLFLVQAADEVVHEKDASKFTVGVRQELLQRTNPEKTQGISIFLPLYVGMRVILQSKECVRLGVMKGCVCVVRHIVLADEEKLPALLYAGELVNLHFLPKSLVLQAEGELWTLPFTELPSTLPRTVDRKGLFQILSGSVYLRVKVEEDYVSVRRTGFFLTPADTFTVYASQGGTYDAVIADMQRPPSLPPTLHWLAC